MNAHTKFTIETIGRYTIERRIGEGAMAHVALAHDPSIGRAVAIKTLKPEYRQQHEVTRRFLDESRAAGRLSHAHIATIYDVGEAEGIPYIAMEYVDGRPLDQLLETEGRISMERALRLASQIASALAYAHAHGVVHRDIKPSNILVGAHGQTAKLLDFGIARVDERDLDQGEREATRTQIGQVMGTPRYMSPEQALGLAVDARSDLFSLGSVLYEMLTNKPAFPGTGIGTLAIQITQDQPIAIQMVVNGCPPGVAAILSSLLAKKPEDRFVDANALCRALQRELDGLKHEPEALRRRMRLSIRLPLVFAGAAACALSVGTWLVLDRQSSTMDEMARHSAQSMTDFVSRNAALRVAENAGLSPEEQDWLPLQAFAETAAQDKSVRRIVIADDTGIVRAASDKTLVGHRFRPLANQAGRIAEPIRYSGANFGTVEMLFDRAPLAFAMADAQRWLVGLSLFVICLIGLIGYVSARRLLRPLRQLRRGMEALIEGERGVRLTARRRDEFTPLFETFNRLSSEAERRHEAPVENILLTRIDIARQEPA